MGTMKNVCVKNIPLVVLREEYDPCMPRTLAYPQ